MKDRYEGLNNFYEAMGKNMGSISAAIGLAASSCFANVKIMATDGEIVEGPPKEKENIITINIIMNSIEDAQKLEGWLPISIREQKKSLELESHISKWYKKVDGLYGIRFIFAENSENTIKYKLKIRISTPILDCVGALELCENDAEAKRLKRIYNLSFVK